MAAGASVLLYLAAAAMVPEQALRLFDESRAQLDRGEVLKARDGFRTAWRMYAAALGEMAPETIEVRIFYGQMLAISDQPDAALTLLGPVSSGNDRVSLVARGAFALALRQKNELKRSAKMLRQILEAFPQETKEDFAHTSRLYGELTTTLDLMKKYKEAEAAAKEGVRLIERSGYASHRAAALIVLGNTQLLARHLETAEATFHAARRVLDPEQQREAGLLEGSFGMLALERGRFEEAERRTRASLEILTRLLGPDHTEVGSTQLQLSIVLQRQKRKAEARQAEAQSRAIFERQKKPGAVASIWTWQEPK